MYRRVEKKAFMVMHCFRILSKCPKWSLETEKKNGKKRATEEVATSSATRPAAEATAALDDEEDSSTTRPGGRKAVKADAKKAREDESATSTLVKLQAEFVKDNKRKLELFEAAKDERIMEMDVDAITSPQRKRYYTIMQANILAKAEARLAEMEANLAARAPSIISASTEENIVENDE
jgi:hypothetical protein